MQRVMSEVKMIEPMKSHFQNLETSKFLEANIDNSDYPFNMENIVCCQGTSE